MDLKCHCILVLIQNSVLIPKLMTKSGNKLETGKKNIHNGFAIAWFFSSTYCKLECVVSILFLAYVVNSQQEVTSVEIIKMRKFYKDTLVRNKFAHFTSLWFAEDTQVPKVHLSLACWFWLLAEGVFQILKITDSIKWCYSQLNLVFIRQKILKGIIFISEVSLPDLLY